jgi:hypothetical protein
MRVGDVEYVRSPSPSKVEGMPTRYDFLVDAMGCIREHSAEHGAHMNAAEVLAALSERDKEIERLKADALDMEYHNPILHADIPSFTDRAKITFRMLEQEIRRLGAELSALQSTPGMEREKALEEVEKAMDKVRCVNGECLMKSVIAAIRALARPAEGKENR